MDLELFPAFFTSEQDEEQFQFIPSFSRGGKESFLENKYFQINFAVVCVWN